MTRRCLILLSQTCYMDMISRVLSTTHLSTRYSSSICTVLSSHKYRLSHHSRHSLEPCWKSTRSRPEHAHSRRQSRTLGEAQPLAQAHALLHVHQPLRTLRNAKRLFNLPKGSASTAPPSHNARLSGVFPGHQQLSLNPCTTSSYTSSSADACTSSVELDLSLVCRIAMSLLTNKAKLTCRKERPRSCCL